MAEPKTRPTKASATQFISKIPDPGMRGDAKRLARMMRRVTGARAEMWGPNIVGFGRFQYKKGTEWMQLGFSPRKGRITVYLPSGIEGLEEQIENLGNPACGKGCVYVEALADMSEPEFEELLRESVKKTRALKPR